MYNKIKIITALAFILSIINLQSSEMRYARKVVRTRFDKYLFYDLKTAKEGISKGANVNALKIDDDGNETSSTALMEADFEVAELLIKAGADLNLQDEDGDTALMRAIIFNSIEKAKLLIDAGADLNIRNEKGRTALDLKDDKEIIKLLKDRMEYLEKAKKAVNSYLSDPSAQILPPVISNLINEYL